MGGHRAGASRGWAWLVMVPVLALLAACGGPGANRTAPTTQTGTVEVVLSWGTDSAAVIPKGINSITSTVTVGTFQASLNQGVDAWPNSTQTVNAPVGTGSLRIDALTSKGSIVFTNSRDITVAPNTTLIVEVVLVPQLLWDTPDSIQITPANSGIAAGTKQQYVAIGTYLNGSTLDITGSVTWNSDSADFATIDPTTGLATGMTPGVAKITATFSNSMAPVPSNVATLTVSPAVVTAVQIAPVTPGVTSIPKGTKLQYQAIATFTNGSAQDVTASAIWDAGVDGVATISPLGLATGLSEGKTVVTAKYSAVPSNGANLEVTPAELKSIQVNPAAGASIPKGTTKHFTATGTYSDGSKQVLTGTAAWSTDNVVVATVSASGLAMGQTVGFANIAATSAGITSDPAVLTVTPAVLVSIQVTPATASVAAGTTQQYTAVGTYTDSSAPDITGSVSWGSSDTALATIDKYGLATGVAQGTVNITATSSDGLVASNTAFLTVTPAVVKSIQVTPAIRSIAKGTSQQYIAVGTYTDNNIQDITGLVSWGGDNTSVATISLGGLATGVTMGTANISANLGTVMSNTAILTVTEATLESIQVSPASASIAAGTSQQFAATGVFTDNSKQNLTGVATWSSDAAGVASITGPGVAKGVATGTADITASLGTVTSNAAVLNVTSATLVSIQVTPPTASIPEGTTQQYAATGTYSDGNTQTITGSVAWGSSNTGAATISAGGLATGVDEGTAKITASLGGISSNSSALTVTSEALVSIQVTPAAASIAKCATQQFTATGAYTDGSVHSITNLVAWATSSTALATIGTNGMVTGVAEGTVSISATLGAVPSNTAALTVTSASDCDHDSNGDDHGKGDGDDHSRRGDDRYRRH